MLSFMEHPKLVSKTILHSIKWQDGNLFENHQNTQVYLMPADLLQMVRREMLKMVGQEVGKNLLYYLNQYSADLIARDADDMGFKGIEKVRYFFGIMALFGWGSVTKFEFNENTKTGALDLKSFPRLSDLYPSSIHYDFAGITARMLELAFDAKCLVTETQCEENGAEICKFEIKSADPSKSIPHYPLKLEKVPQIDAKAIADNKEFESFLDTIAMAENGVLLINNNLENRVVVKDVLSINSMVNANAETLGRKTVGAVLYRCAKDLKFHFSTMCTSCEEIENILKRLELMGWGRISIEKPAKLGSENENSLNKSQVYTVYVKKSAFILGIPKGDSGLCHIIGGVLHNLFAQFLGTDHIIVKEECCVAKGDESCKFTIKIF
jgi:predicted hydrocarbon binding protein